MKFGFINENFADIHFIVEGQPIPAHKVVVCARSAYFRAMLMGGLKESRQQSIELHSASREAFLPVLEFLYTKKVDFEKIEETIVDVFLLACEYQVRKLKSLLEDVIAYNLSGTLN
jgi:BTB/POZ domain-containing protein 9